MSRRKQRAALHAELILQCPHGHELGSIVATRTSGPHRLDEPLRDRKDSPFRPLVIGEKIKALCPACKEAGRHPDYQASWETVQKEITAGLGDTQSEQRILKLGPPLC
jgi:hypothetical protein